MKLLTVIWTFLLFALGVQPAYAEWLYNGKAVTDSQYVKTNGEFGAMLVFSDEPERLFESWNQDILTVEGNFIEKVKRK